MSQIQPKPLDIANENMILTPNLILAILHTSVH